MYTPVKIKGFSMQDLFLHWYTFGCFKFLNLIYLKDEEDEEDLDSQPTQQMSSHVARVACTMSSLAAWYQENTKARVSFSYRRV